MKAKITLALLLIASTATAKTTALVGGTVHPVTSKPVKNATLLFDESGILSISAGGEIPEDARRVNCEGKHIYPSLIAAHTQIGLIEVPTVRGTVDTSETGRFNPNAVAHVAFNPDSEVIPVTRSNGVLLAVSSPTGGTVSGQSSLMKLGGGWTWEQMLQKPKIAMQVNWPRSRSDGSELKELEDYIAKAKRYRDARAGDAERTKFDIRWEAMQPLLNGEQPMIASTNRLAGIQSAVAFAAKHRLRLIILGGYDAPHCAPLLKKHNVPVIISGVHRIPTRRSEPYDAAYTLPERLRKAGVRFCISGEERFASNVRNLPYHAATAAAYGLPKDEALKAVTLYPAQILGVADRVGSLEKGKAATLFLTNGDPLETPTQITAAYVDGQPIDLSDRHKRLYNKFKQRLKKQ